MSTQTIRSNTPAPTDKPSVTVNKSPITNPYREMYELKFRNAQVSHVEQPDDCFIRVTFTGSDLADFQSKGFDDHLKFLFDDEQGQSTRRDYTPRSFDNAKQQVTIEFALHENGKATQWARQAQPGQSVTLVGPRGSLIIAKEYHWHLLIGDLTALPAIRRRLEELDGHKQVKVMLLQPDGCSLEAINHTSTNTSTRTSAQISYFTESEDLTEAVQTFELPKGEGFIWAAGERQMMATLKQILIKEKQHHKSASRIAAYWQQGQENVHEEMRE